MKIANDDECFKAARQLGYKDQYPYSGSYTDKPPGCSVHKHNTIFNTNQAGEQRLGHMPDDDGMEWMEFLNIICKKKSTGLFHNVIK